MSITLENQEPKADCSVITSFNMQLIAPLSWGLTFERDLAAAPPGLPEGMAILGIPSSGTFNKSGSNNQFRNPAFWLEVLRAPADQKFGLLAAFTNYLPPPEAPDGPEE
jgi:hypothetical protein